MNMKSSFVARLLCLILAILMIGGTASYAIFELFLS